jgi:hypothetical protein
MTSVKEVLVSMVKDDAMSTEHITTRVTTGEWSLDEMVLAGASILNVAYHEGVRQNSLRKTQEEFQNYVSDVLTAVMSQSSILEQN